ncbi:MAG: hypothetical protein P4L46_07215 [Fimbriimonas sp.]|nr:hypothetical protein [Fimbriimonas sp.]
MRRQRVVFGTGTITRDPQMSQLLTKLRSMRPLGRAGLDRDVVQLAGLLAPYGFDVEIRLATEGGTPGVVHYVLKEHGRVVSKLLSSPKEAIVAANYLATQRRIAHRLSLI